MLTKLSFYDSLQNINYNSVYKTSKVNYINVIHFASQILIFKW